MLAELSHSSILRRTAKSGMPGSAEHEGYVTVSIGINYSYYRLISCAQYIATDILSAIAFYHECWNRQGSDVVGV
jgi:hypothetical protein